MKNLTLPGLGGNRLVLALAGVVVVAGLAAGVFLFSGGGATQAPRAGASPRLDALANRLGDALREELDSVRAALDDAPGLARALQDGGTAPVARLAELHPSILAVRLLQTGHREVDYGTSPPLTYAAIDMLRQAEESPARPPAPELILPGTGNAHVALLVPVGQSGEGAAGHAFVAVDAAVVQRALRRVELVEGQVKVLQPVAGSAPVELASLGAATATSPVSRAVPGFGWRVSYAPPGQATDEDGIALRSLLVLAGAVVLVVAAVAVVWRVWGRGGAAEPLEGAGKPEPVMMDGTGPDGGAMSRETPQFAEADYMGRSGVPDAGITVTEEGVAGEGEPEMDFMEAFSDDAAPKEPPPAPTASGDGPPASLFRAYDIRGPVAGGLDAELARQVGRAAGSAAAARDEGGFVVGRDGRSNSPELAEAAIGGLVESGMDVIDVGLMPTPVVYFAARYLDVGCCLVITGSHNPPDDNGIKLVIGGEPPSPEDIQDLRRRILEDDLVSGSGKQQQMDVGADYIRRISEDIPVALGNAFKLVVDCANGATSELAPRLFRALGHDVVDLFCTVDGSFPNHPPDPSDPANLAALRAAVKEQGADLGMALDGDGDRLVVVDSGGNIIWPDRLLMVFARDVLERNPGAEILYDVKCSRHLPKVIAEAGGKPVMWKSGHSLMKAKMAATGAPLGGEMSGHFFFKERWYGFDDGLYAGARLLEILQGSATSPRELFAALPQAAATPELRVAVPEGAQHRIMAGLAEAGVAGAEVDRTDGIRAEFSDGFGLVRASNTTSSLVFRFEADDAAALERIQSAFREVVAGAQPGLQLPF